MFLYLENPAIDRIGLGQICGDLRSYFSLIGLAVLGFVPMRVHAFYLSHLLSHSLSPAGIPERVNDHYGLTAVAYVTLVSQGKCNDELL